MDSIVPRNGSQDHIPSTPGIYRIRNVQNGDFYVGSAVKLSHRKEHHFNDLRKGNHKNHHLQRAYNLYGPKAFIFEVIEQVDQPDTLLSREQHFIDTLNPQYNIARTAGSNLGMKFTDEHRAKISAARKSNEHMREQMDRLHASRVGKHLSPEHRAKIVANQIGRRHSPESKAKMSTVKIGKKKSPEHAENIRKAKLGKKRDPETIAKIAASKRGQKQTPEHIAKRTASQLGKPLSPEVRAKISATKQAKKLASQQVTQLPLF